MATTSVASAQTNPVEKVIEMLSDLQQKIIGEGEAAQKVYDEFAEWCEEESKNLQYEIKTGKAEVADLKATIDKEASNIVAQTATIEELGASIATDEADLKAATEIRNKEQAVFSEEEKDLVETIDTLERAVGIIEKEMKGGSAALLQSSGSVVQALETMVKAQSLSSAEGARLTALVQDKQKSDDDDDDSGAPQAAAYSNQSGGIVDTLNDLLEKAQTQLDTARAKEEADIQNFEMLVQSLTDEIKFAKQDKIDYTVFFLYVVFSGRSTRKHDFGIDQVSEKESEVLLCNCETAMRAAKVEKSGCFWDM